MTSPAVPENSPNAMDGMTFILQFLVAAADSIANIRNNFNTAISSFCSILFQVILYDNLQFNQERNRLVLRPVSRARIEQ